jgi:hypothetical protein
LRSRAHALGTDHGFTLVDQAYVFAGFRFALLTLVALLVISPLLILLKLVTARVVRVTAPKRLAILDRLAAIALAILTLASFQTLFVEGALLDDRPGRYTLLSRMFFAGALGDTRVGAVVVLMATGTTAITILWLRSRSAQTSGGDSLTIVLAVIAALQLVLLQIKYGIFFANKTARVLERPPEGVIGVSPPVWLLDRGADRASLVARGQDGRLSLFTVKIESLDGIAVTGTAEISEIARAGAAR